jgi:hypothetical protein
MLMDERPQPIQLVSSKTMGLCDPIALLDVDVHRFRSLKAVKEEAKARNPEDSWHWVSSATSIRLHRTRINAARERSPSRIGAD